VRVIAADDLRTFDSYREIERPIPQPGPGEIRVKVVACGLGYVDALDALGGYQVKPALPHVPGGEVSGTVDALLSRNARTLCLPVTAADTLSRGAGVFSIMALMRFSGWGPQPLGGSTTILTSESGCRRRSKASGNSLKPILDVNATAASMRPRAMSSRAPANSSKE
jgi:hypothetical protein